MISGGIQEPPVCLDRLSLFANAAANGAGTAGGSPACGVCAISPPPAAPHDEGAQRCEGRVSPSRAAGAESRPSREIVPPPGHAVQSRPSSRCTTGDAAPLPFSQPCQQLPPRQTWQSWHTWQTSPHKNHGPFTTTHHDAKTPSPRAQGRVPAKRLAVGVRVLWGWDEGCLVKA